MYNFIDTVQVSEGIALPSEALAINGVYIENIIPGYRTLGVAGRESLSPEIASYETGVRDGARVKNRRFPARYITVSYQLIADTNEAFREAYNRLGGILNVENAELIFNDEQDKYYIGTPSAIGEVEPGRNAVTGEIEFYCADPFKYSVAEYEAEATEDGSILVNYEGTYKSFPVLEADFYQETEVGPDGETATALTGDGDCGYVAFFNEDKKIIQLGNPAEEDGRSENAYPPSQTLMNQTFLSETAWGTTAKKLWAVNNGTILPNDVVQTGSVKMQPAAYADVVDSTTGSLIKITSTGSAPSIAYTVTAKATNRTSTTVDVTVSITASLGKDTNYMGNGLILIGSVLMEGYWHDVTIKKSEDYWKGKTAHTVSRTFTVSNLTQAQNTLASVQFKVYRDDGKGSAGVITPTPCNSLMIPAYSAALAEQYYLTADSYGTAAGKYHGPSITRTLSADASGVLGASQWILTYRQMMGIGTQDYAINQLGGFHCHVTTESGVVIAGVRIVKNKRGSRAASLMLFVNGQKVHQVGIDMSYRNPFFGYGESSVKTSTIRKTGNQVVFNIAGYCQSFVDDDIEEMAARKVTFAFEQYDTNGPLHHNGLYWAKFTKNNCATFSDIPNKFSANDVLEADCKNGEIYLNGILSPEYGALGNDWEDFYLKPGLNQIGFSYSEWLTGEYVPNMKVRYREVYL